MSETPGIERLWSFPGSLGARLTVRELLRIPGRSGQ